MVNSLQIRNENLNNIQSVFLARISIEVAESSHKLDQGLFLLRGFDFPHVATFSAFLGVYRFE